MVASHTAVPLGTAKWLVRVTPTPETLPLGKGHTQPMSPTQGQAYIIRGNPIPAISQPLNGQLYGWLPLSDAAGINYYWALQMGVLDTPGLQIWLNDYLSNNIRILTQKNRGYWSRKGHSVEKTAIFSVFGNSLIDRWLREYRIVIGWFTKCEFARGKVSQHERPCFVV